MIMWDLDSAKVVAKIKVGDTQDDEIGTILMLCSLNLLIIIKNSLLLYNSNTCNWN